MTVASDLGVTSTIGFVVDLPVTSTILARSTAHGDLTVLSSIRGLSVNADLTVQSSIAPARRGRPGKRWRRRHSAPTVVP